MFEVTYMVLATGIRLTKEFPSPYLRDKFINKLRHSKKCVFLGYIRID